MTEPVRRHHPIDVGDPFGGRRDNNAVANRWSGYGYQDAPTEVIRMLVNAIETGYVADAGRRSRPGPARY